jgi:hypothetical protein
LENTVNQHPVSQGSVTKSTRRPIHGQKDAARYRYQNSRNATEEHDYLDKPSGLLWILLNHVQERVRVVGKVICSIEEGGKPLPYALLRCLLSGCWHFSNWIGQPRAETLH